MSKIVPQFKIREWPSDLPLAHMSCDVLVPYDALKGGVFLNACGTTETEVFHALDAIEMDDEVRSSVKVVSATLDFSDEAALQSNLFPVVVPVHHLTGEVHYGGIGCNPTESEANLDYVSEDVTDYRFVGAMMRMPDPSLECDAGPLLPSP